MQPVCTIEHIAWKYFFCVCQDSIGFPVALKSAHTNTVDEDDLTTWDNAWNVDYTRFFRYHSLLMEIKEKSCGDLQMTYHTTRNQMVCERMEGVCQMSNPRFTNAVM